MIAFLKRWGWTLAAVLCMSVHAFRTEWYAALLWFIITTHELRDAA